MKVLVVDDEVKNAELTAAAIADAGHETAFVNGGAAAIARLEAERWDAVVTDLRMKQPDGMALLAEVRQRWPETIVLLMTAYASLATAQQAIRLGAHDYVEKEGDFHEVLAHKLAEAAATRALRHENRDLTAQVASLQRDALNVVGEAPATRRALDLARKVAITDSTVLLRGESGTGKDLFARTVHALSRRAGGPYIKVNCGALPEALLESELFGHEKGAFTGATQARLGHFEEAQGGTLFLDEIGDLALDAQAKLLRVLETGEIERVGGTRTASVDVRLIAATNKDLPAAVRDGTFREDLWFRLNVLPLHVPPLRERRADIVMLAEHFLALFAAAEGRAPLALADDARALLEDYHWPGNVREMRNLMERAVVLVPGDTVTAADLDAWLESPPEESAEAGLKGSVARSEIESIRRALDAADWNVTQAAAGLGIDRTNLHRKMRKYGITRR